MKNNKNSIIVGVIIILVLLLLLTGVSYSFLTGRIFVFDDNVAQDPARLAISRVSIGDSREDALIALSDAWFHSECRRTDIGPIEDLFFYGSHEPDKVKIVLIRSRENAGATTVDLVGSIENYMIHLYDHCVPLPESAFGEP